MKSSELILNPDGSVYHLHLLPDDIGETILLVGDQNRVALVSDRFDRIDTRKEHREFITHTGWLGGKRLSVISTGIGTDNVDIVLNELDALVNIDLSTREIKQNLNSLNLIRIGTSGSIHPDVHVDDLIVSGRAVGTDSLAHYYGGENLIHPLLPAGAYITSRYPFRLSAFSPFSLHPPQGLHALAPQPVIPEGITLTCEGFYGPQGRSIRMPVAHRFPIDDLHTVKIDGLPFTNLEMETSAIYLLAEKMGHRAISFNAIIAHRLEGRFSSRPQDTIDRLIREVLDWVTTAF